ncbi:hypothetical protein D3C80_2124970 [compost metagenome]
MKLSFGVVLPTEKPAPLIPQLVWMLVAEVLNGLWSASLSLASKASAGTVTWVEKILVMMWSAPATGALLV